MRRFAIPRLFLAVLLPSACMRCRGPAERGRHDPALIVGRDAHVDDTHTAVVAVMGGAGRMCSGTVVGISDEGGTLQVLTAAHCCTESAPPKTIRLGGDFSQPARVLTVEKYRQHPCYNPLGYEYDFCVIQAKDAGRLNIRPIPLASGPDGLAAGGTLTFVGYGSTPATNVARRRVEAHVAAVSPLTFATDQTNSRGGVCFGDSGGPALIVQNGVEVVAGVASFGAPTSLCDVVGVAGRVDSLGVRKEFLDKVLAGEEPTIDNLLVLRAGSSPGQVRDTYLASDAPQQNFGDSVVLYAGAPSGTSAVRRVLLRFDLLGVPSGATILSAYVGLHQESKTGSGTIAVHRVTKDWDEDRETWASFGEDGFDPTPVATFSNATAIVSSTEEVWFDVTDLSRDWLAGRAENYGLMLREPDHEQTELMSSEIGRLSERPWMHLCYMSAPR